MILPLAMMLAGAGVPGDPLVGTWRGTSTCQAQPAPCTNEIAVYEIAARGANRYRVAMKKIVDGDEVLMGTLDATYDPATHKLTATTYDRQKRPGRWVFTLTPGQLHGVLLTGANVTYRKIELRQSANL